MDALVQLSDVTKQYDDDKSPAVAHVTVAVGHGESVAVMGPSGSGKSTLLNLIAGLDRPSTGTVRVGDVQVGELSETGLARFRRRQVGMIFQFFNLLDDMTVADNVLLPAQLPGVPSSKARGPLAELPHAVRVGAGGGDRAGAGDPAAAATRRRAHGGAGLGDRGGDRRVAARPEFLGADADRGHARSRAGRPVR